MAYLLQIPFQLRFPLLVGVTFHLSIQNGNSIDFTHHCQQLPPSHCHLAPRSGAVASLRRTLHWRLPTRRELAARSGAVGGVTGAVTAATGRQRWTRRWCRLAAVGMVGRTAVIGSGSWCKVKPKAINLAESSMWGWFRQSIKKVIFGDL